MRPPKKIVFCLNSFTKKNLALQPWLTIYNISKYLIKKNCEIYVVTDSKSCKIIDGINICQVKSLRNKNSKQILQIIDAIKPNCVVISVTPCSLIGNLWYRKIKNTRKIAYFSYSLYNNYEILKSLKFLSNKQKYEFGRQVFVPTRMAMKVLQKKFDAAICQSSRSYNRLKSWLRDVDIHKIDPGIELDKWGFKKKKDVEETRLLYTGSPLKIRGFWNLLEAFSKIENEKVSLRILARGASGKQIGRLTKMIAQRYNLARIELCGGWSQTRSLVDEFWRADLLVLPFVLVPSELPVTLMESIACGTPVLVTDIDGLPDAVGDAGLVVPHADINALIQNLKNYIIDDNKKKDLHASCVKKRNQMKTWDEVGEIWKEILSV